MKQDFEIEGEKAAAAAFNNIAKKAAYRDTLSSTEILAFEELLDKRAEYFFLNEERGHAIPFLNKLMDSGTYGRNLMLRLLSDGSHRSIEEFNDREGHYGRVYAAWMDQFTVEERFTVLAGITNIDDELPSGAEDRYMQWLDEFSPAQRAKIFTESYVCASLIYDFGEVEKVASWLDEFNPEQRTDAILSDDILGLLCRHEKPDVAQRYFEELSEEQKIRTMACHRNIEGFCTNRAEMVIDWMDGLDNDQRTFVLASADEAVGQTALHDKVIEWMDNLDNDQRAIVLKKGGAHEDAVISICYNKMEDHCIRWLNELSMEQRHEILFNADNGFPNHGLRMLSWAGHQEAVKSWLDELPPPKRAKALDDLSENKNFDRTFFEQAPGEENKP